MIDCRIDVALLELRLHYESQPISCDTSSWLTYHLRKSSVKRDYVYSVGFEQILVSRCMSKYLSRLTLSHHITI